MRAATVYALNYRRTGSFVHDWKTEWHTLTHRSLNVNKVPDKSLCIAESVLLFGTVLVNSALRNDVCLCTFTHHIIL